jgi:hypothetical protein
MINDMRDHLTYATLAGHRRWRRYVIATALILVFIGLLFGWTGWQQVRAWAARSEPEPTPIDEGNFSVAAAKPEKATLIPESGNCPTDPELWRLLDVVPDDNYKRIEPHCGYEGLTRTVAWHMLERLGHTKQEAAELLGFGSLPWRPIPAIKGLTNTRGPMTIPFDIEWAPHPAYRSWAIDAQGQPALTYSLRGCYRMRTIAGSDVESWGEYPVICVVAYDRDPGWAVSELGEQRLSVDLATEPALRRFVFFGYSGETWVLLGEASDWQKVIEEPSAAEPEREKVTAWYGTVPWDAAWLQATFGLDMHPLPDGWQTFGLDPDTAQAIANELDQALGEFGGSP